MRNTGGVVAAAALACLGAHANARDSLCSALRTFAENIPPGSTSSVTLKTDWSEPAAACLRTPAPHEVAFCEYLITDVSMEFMANNIRRALKCMGGNMDDLYLEHIAGKVQADRPTLIKKPVTVNLEFDSAPAEGLPFLTISVTAQ